MNFISYESAAHLLDWKEAVEVLRQGHTRGAPQQGDILIGPQGALMLNRAAFISGVGYAVKSETTIPANSDRGLPTIQGAVLYFDADTGGISAVIDGKLVTEYKTAADSVLGATFLARPDSKHLVIIGAGTVAKSLVRAYSAVFPNLKKISIWARRHEQAEALIASISGISAEITFSADLEETVGTADIVATTTGARAPVLFGDWVRPGTHVDMIGGYTPEMRETDDALISKGTIYVDYKDTTVDLVGDLVQPIASGVITPEAVVGDLYDLVAQGNQTARKSRSEITIYKNGGGAHLDLMIAEYIAYSFRQK